MTAARQEQAAEDRVMPHSHEAERSVLGAILVHNPAYWDVTHHMRADDMYREAHRRVFVALGRLAERKMAMDLVTLTDELRRSGDLEECGGPSYVAALVEGVPRATNAPYYARIVREKARLRALTIAARQQEREALAQEDDASAIADRALGRLSEAVGTRGSGLVSADAAVRSYVEAVGDGKLGDPLLTGYADVDSLVGGFRPGDLVVLAARPSVGKTSFALGMADHMASGGHRTALFPLETGRRSVAARLLALRSGVPHRAFEASTATAEQYTAISEAVCRPDVPLVVEDTAKTVLEVESWCRLAAAEGPLSCVVIDYLQLLRPQKEGRSDEGDVAAISHALKALAKDLGVVVVALSQLSRASEDRRDKRPAPSDLRGSGALEQDCDVCLLLFRAELYSRKDEDRGKAECIVAKNRDGACGVVRLAFRAEVSAFADAARGEEF